MRSYNPFGTCRGWKEYAGRPNDDQLPQARSRSKGKGEDSNAGRRGRMC